MDIEFARTFLKIVDTGSFVAASRALHLTQAAISRRIRSLEEYLGCTLFVRSRSGVSLTPAGNRFLRYAINLVQTLEQSRQDVGVAPAFDGSLRVGGRFGLWDDLLLDWLERLSNSLPRVQMRAQIGFEEGLMQDLVDGVLDIGIMYTPQNRPTLQVEKLLEEELILVTTEQIEGHTPNPERYVHVDWGQEFLSQLNAKLPELASPRITVGISWLGLQRIFTTGGSGYFPKRQVLDLIRQERLHTVSTAPSFQLPAYVVYPRHPNNPLTAPAVNILHQLAALVK